MRLVKIALPLFFAAGLGLFAARAWTDSSDRSARALSLEHARRQFAERAALVRAAPDAEQYRADLKALLRGWFAGQMELGNRFPTLRGVPAPFSPLPPKIRGGDLGEWTSLAESILGPWREGRVELFQTALSQGLRLDLLQVNKLLSPQPHLAIDAAVWGAPEETEFEEPSPGKVSRRVTVPLVFRGLSLSFFDASGRLVARMGGDGEPALRLDVPERLVADAPPGVVLARFEPALFPPGVAEVELTLAVQLRSGSGEARVAQGSWRCKVDPAWTGAGWSDTDQLVAETAAAPPPAAPSASHQQPGIVLWPVRER